MHCNEVQCSAVAAAVTVLKDLAGSAASGATAVGDLLGGGGGDAHERDVDLQRIRHGLGDLCNRQPMRIFAFPLSLLHFCIF